MFCLCQCPKCLEIRKPEKSFLGNRERESNKMKTSGAPGRWISHCSAFTLCYTSDCGAQQSCSQFDTESKELCSPLRLAILFHSLRRYSFDPLPQVASETRVAGISLNIHTAQPFSFPFKRKDSCSITFLSHYFYKII